MPAASAPPTDLASVEARFVHYAEPAPHPACSREAAEERSRRREPPGSAVPPSSAPKRAEDGQGAAAPAPPFSSPCSAWGRDHWTLLRPEKGRPGSGAASGACGWLTRSRTSWSSPSLTRGPSRVMKRGAGGPPGGSGGGLGVLAGQGGAEAPWAAREACGRWCLLGNDAGKAADRKGLEWRPLREVWRAASRCPVHRSAYPVDDGPTRCCGLARKSRLPPAARRRPCGSSRCGMSTMPACGGQGANGGHGGVR